jgi:DNA-directed RNA polymerase subunit K/omega
MADHQYIMSKYEKAKIAGVRLQQLARGAQTLVDTTGMTNIRQILDAEFEQKLLPFIVVRTLPNGKQENIKVSQMIIPL